MALAYLGMAADEQGELTLAVARFQESLTLSQRCNDVAGTAYALRLAGGNSAGYAEACRLCSESLELWRKVGRPDRIANLSNILAWKLCCSGDYAAANAHWREGLALCEQLDLPNEKAWALDCLGFVSWHQGDLAAAEQYFQEALAIYTTLGRQNIVSMCKAEYSLVLVDKGQIEQAFVLVREAVAIARQVNSQMFLILGLNYLGAALIVVRDFAAARQALCEAVQRAWQRSYFDHLMTAFYYFAKLLIHESKVSALPSTIEQQDLALTLLSCVQNQPLAWQMFKDKAAQLQAKLEDILPAEVCATAIARGQNASVAEMVTTLLEVVIYC